jgi:NAD-dependent SIR2 family protein deacetylase
MKATTNRKPADDATKRGTSANQSVRCPACKKASKVGAWRFLYLEEMTVSVCPKCRTEFRPQDVNFG